MAEPICCTNCGFRIENQEGISFCPSCGMRIGVDAAPKMDANGNCIITVRYPSAPANIGGKFSYFAISIDGKDRYKNELPNHVVDYTVPPGPHTIAVRQLNNGITAHVVRASMELTVKGGEVIIVESTDNSLRMYCDSFMMPLRSDDLSTTYPGNLRYCPYCKTVVRTGRIRWLWFFIFLLFGPLLIYLIYCLVSSGRICKSCKHRIYRPKN